MIKEQLEEVRKNIEEACKRAGRDPKRGHSDRSEQDQTGTYAGRSI